MRHPENYNYFQVFDIDQAYDIDIKDLSERFKALQRMFHPDIFTQVRTKNHKLRFKHQALLITFLFTGEIGVKVLFYFS
jgi:hypothetical protein